VPNGCYVSSSLYDLFVLNWHTHTHTMINIHVNQQSSDVSIPQQIYAFD